MKRMLFFIFCSISIGISCGQKVNEADVTNAENTTQDVLTEIEKDGETAAMEEESQAIPPPPPPPSKKRIENEKKESSKSVFLNLGCCSTPAERLNDCCCLEVLEKYTELHGNKDPKLGDYKMKDPILGNCRRKLAKAFELVDYPPKVEVEVEADDDLF